MQIQISHDLNLTCGLSQKTVQQSARNPTSLQPSFPRNHWSQRVSHFTPGLTKTLPSWPGVFRRYCRVVSIIVHITVYNFVLPTYLYTSIPWRIWSASSIPTSAGAVVLAPRLRNANGGLITLLRVISWSWEWFALEAGIWCPLIKWSTKSKGG